MRLDEKINAMRVIKDESELEKLRKAAELADYAIEIGCKEIAEGKTEMEILTAIESAIQDKGCKMSFETMVLSGPKLPLLMGSQVHVKLKKVIWYYLTLALFTMAIAQILHVLLLLVSQVKLKRNLSNCFSCQHKCYRSSKARCSCDGLRQNCT